MTTSIAFPQITNRRIATNGIELNIAEQGDPNAPLIVMLHGFPESWFHGGTSSHLWRLQAITWWHRTCAGTVIPTSLQTLVPTTNLKW